MKKKFHVNPNSKTVVCEVSNCKDIMDECKNMKPLFFDMIRMFHYNVDTIDSAFSDFKGIARCMDEDEFDEKTGKTIAESKAVQKYHRRIANDYMKLLVAINEMRIQLMDKYKYHMEKAKDEEDYIRRIGK